MLGFSLGKILVLVVIVAGVWYGFKLVGRLEKRRKERAAEEARIRASEPPETGDMVKCRVCDAFVLARGAMSCGRADCPY